VLVAVQQRIPWAVGAGGLVVNSYHLLGGCTGPRV